ncbi:MAG: preprotein translocase subunit YajC [bacterium]|nr:preprotein translocase subunit YajC [bacterium]
MELIFMVAIFGLLIWWMSRSAKKQRQAQEDARDAALVVGATVRTIGGFFGTVVDIDGDAITLESPSGVETVWLRGAIQGPATLPLASTLEAEAAEAELAVEETAAGEIVAGEPAANEPVVESANETVSTIEDPIEKRDRDGI